MTIRRDPAFRPITEDDCKRTDVAEFNCGDEPWQTEVAEFLTSGEALKLHKPDRKLTLLYCQDGGEGDVMGYASIVRKRGNLGDESVPYLHIVYFGVGINLQGHGHGTRMLGILKAVAEAGGAAFIDLFVHERNLRAIQMYERNGFSFLDVAPHENENGRYVRMARKLG